MLLFKMLVEVKVDGMDFVVVSCKVDGGMIGDGLFGLCVWGFDIVNGLV